MDDEKATMTEAYEIWNEFENELLFKNRYFCKNKVLYYIDNTVNSSQTILDKDTSLFRARILDSQFIVDNSPKSHHYYGFNEAESGAPINKLDIGDGRANPAYISYLYAAETKQTAIYEVRPFIGAKVSVAELKLINNITVADLTLSLFKDWLSNNDRTLKHYLDFFIYMAFSTPIGRNREKYIVTQYISEYLKQKGFGGVRFHSSIDNEGTNITIFDSQQCKAINSCVYEINKVLYDIKLISPESESALYLDQIPKIIKQQ